MKDGYHKREILASIISNGVLAQGKRQLKEHLHGKKQTRKNAMLAKCYECMGYYADGKSDCEMQECPMYPYNPYAERA